MLIRTSGGRIRALFALVFALVLGLAGTYHAVHAFAQDDPDCSEQGTGDGASGGAGGAGGGMCGGGGAGGNPGGRPGATGEPSDSGNGSAGGGDGGNGSNGTTGSNNLPTPTPPPPSQGGSPGGAGGTTSASTKPAASPTGTTPEAVANLAKNLSTKPDEVKSWFGALNADDSVAGQARSIVVHPDDQVTIFAGDRADAQSDGTILRTGIEGLGDANTKGGDAVDITLHSNPVTLGSTVTEVGGRFSATVRIPPDTEVGRHFIIALVPNTHNGRAAFIYPLTVTAREQAAALAENVTPTGGDQKRFPWVALELLVGSISVVALFVVRVRRASAAGV